MLSSRTISLTLLLALLLLGTWAVLSGGGDRNNNRVLLDRRLSGWTTKDGKKETRNVEEIAFLGDGKERPKSVGQESVAVNAPAARSQQINSGDSKMIRIEGGEEVRRLAETDPDLFEVSGNKNTHPPPPPGSHSRHRGLPFTLPPPYEDLSWGTGSGGTSSDPQRKKSQLQLTFDLLEEVSSLLVKRNIEDSIFNSNKDWGFKITEKNVELLVGIAVQRIAATEYTCTIPIISKRDDSPGKDDAMVLEQQCRRALRSNLRKALVALAEAYNNALYFVTSRDPFQEGQPMDAGQLWTSLYPVIGCSYSPRHCRQPDGCRFFCNPRALQEKGKQAAAKKGPGLNFVGIGCSDQFDHEESLIDQFSADRSKRDGRDGSVANVAVFDCTVAPENLHPPKVLQGFDAYHYINKCLVSHNLTGPPKGLPPIDITQLVGEATTHRLTKKDDEVGTQGGVMGEEKATSAFVPNKIDVFKVDMEGSEFGVFHEWLVLSLKYEVMTRFGDHDDNSHHHHHHHQPPPPEVSLLMFEIHLPILSGRKWKPKVKYMSALQAGMIGHLCFLELAALGFLVARTERNPWFAALAEVMAPSVKYFVESESYELLHTL